MYFIAFFNEPSELFAVIVHPAVENRRVHAVYAVIPDQLFYIHRCFLKRHGYKRSTLRHGSYHIVDISKYLSRTHIVCSIAAVNSGGCSCRPVTVGQLSLLAYAVPVICKYHCVIIHIVPEKTCFICAAGIRYDSRNYSH